MPRKKLKGPRSFMINFLLRAIIRVSKRAPSVPIKMISSIHTRRKMRYDEHRNIKRKWLTWELAKSNFCKKKITEYLESIFRSMLKSMK